MIRKEKPTKLNLSSKYINRKWIHNEIKRKLYFNEIRWLLRMANTTGMNKLINITGNKMHKYDCYCAECVPSMYFSLSFRAFCICCHRRSSSQEIVDIDFIHGTHTQFYSPFVKCWCTKLSGTQNSEYNIYINLNMMLFFFFFSFLWMLLVFVSVSLFHFVFLHSCK